MSKWQAGLSIHRIFYLLICAGKQGHREGDLICFNSLSLDGTEKRGSEKSCFCWLLFFWLRIFTDFCCLCLLFSFERLLLHAVCQYMDLVSASEWIVVCSTVQISMTPTEENNKYINCAICGKNLKSQIEAWINYWTNMASNSYTNNYSTKKFLLFKINIPFLFT